MTTIDCLLVHPSAGGAGRLCYNVMPMGLFGIADMLRREGFECRILNTGVERALNRNFSLEGYLRQHTVGCVAIGLHWYVHAYSAIETARRAWETAQVPVVLGGYTASAFPEEIVRRHPFVDCVIRGEGEVPLVEYLRALRRERPDHGTVPNVVFRRNGGVAASEKRWQADGAFLDMLDYGDLSLMEHGEYYTRISMRSVTGSYANIPKPIDQLFYLFAGRGCSMNCSYCAGGALAYRSISGRSWPGFRSPERAVAEMAVLRERGIRHFYFEFDPYPMSEEWYLSLFRRVRGEGLDAGCNFGCWYPHSDGFLEMFARTFDTESSCAAISPESGCERVRGINRHPSYSNDALVRLLNRKRELGIYTSVHFTVGLPHETRADFEETLRLFPRLARGGRVRITLTAIPVEPGSPVSTNPKRHGVVLYRKDFQDFYDYARAIARQEPHPHPLGYRTEHLSEDDILSLELKAFRRLYLRPEFVLNRASKMQDLPALLDNAKILAATLVGSPRLLCMVKR